MWSRVTLYKYLRCQVFNTGSNFNYLSKSWFPLSRIFYVRTCVKLTFKNNIEAMYDRSHVSVKVEPRSSSRLISTLYFLPLFYLRALTGGAKNASVEIHPNVTYVSRMCLYGLLSTWLSRTLLAALPVHRIEIPCRAFPEGSVHDFGYRLKTLITLEQVITSVVEKKNNHDEQNFEAYWKITSLQTYMRHFIHRQK